MNVKTYKGPRIGLTVRVCPDTYQGLIDAAQDLGCTLQDCILGAVLMEYGLYTYSPDALVCPITAGDIDRWTQAEQRRIARIAGPLYRPPEWWAEQARAGSLPYALEDLADVARAAMAQAHIALKAPILSQITT